MEPFVQEKKKEIELSELSVGSYEWNKGENDKDWW